MTKHKRIYCILCESPDDYLRGISVSRGRKLCKLCGDILYPKHMPDSQYDMYYKHKYKDPQHILQDRKKMRGIYSFIETTRAQDSTR